MRASALAPLLFIFLFLSVFLAIAVAGCGGGSAPSPDGTPSTMPKSTPTTATTTATTSSSARPTCDAIDRACDPHEDKGGLAKECHDLGENAATDEATCIKRKDACLAACPPKS